ncbi:hypothetical protein, partial [Pantoea ananatis]|uniref:hypothetical protein n=1 Tax=Pantoea ananas TaxID=553 RepID=UPI001C3C5080
MPKRLFYTVTALPSLSHTGHILLYAPADVFALRLVTPQNHAFPQILYPGNNAENSSVSQPKRLWRCKV